LALEKAPHAFETSETAYPTTQRNSPGVPNPQIIISHMSQRTKSVSLY